MHDLREDEIPGGADRSEHVAEERLLLVAGVLLVALSLLCVLLSLLLILVPLCVPTGFRDSMVNSAARVLA